MSSRKIMDINDLLKPGNMIYLYAQGAFPMADESGEINWYQPETRTIIPLDNYNFPRSLKIFMKEAGFEFYFDRDPMRVIKSCAARDKTWISDKLINAYEGLWKSGHVHSVETYLKGKLVGGLYGVTFRGAFFGESMFSKSSQASKAALIKLIQRLNQKDYLLLDIQFQSNHFKMFGSKEISFEEFQKLLFEAYKRDVKFI